MSVQKCAGVYNLSQPMVALGSQREGKILTLLPRYSGAAG